MPLTLNFSVTLDDATLAAIRGGTPVVVPPVVVPPVVVPPVEPPTAEVPAVVNASGWHGDFRLQPTSSQAKNFNWLQDQHGANVAWNYLMIEWAALGNDFKSQADAIWPAGESNMVVNHYSNQGSYAPAEYSDPGRKICNVKLGVFSYDMGKKKINLPFYP